MFNSVLLSWLGVFKYLKPFMVKDEKSKIKTTNIHISNYAGFLPNQ